MFRFIFNTFCFVLLLAILPIAYGANLNYGIDHWNIYRNKICGYEIKYPKASSISMYAFQSLEKNCQFSINFSGSEIYRTLHISKTKNIPVSLTSELIKEVRLDNKNFYKMINKPKSGEIYIDYFIKNGDKYFKLEFYLWQYLKNTDFRHDLREFDIIASTFNFINNH